MIRACEFFSMFAPEHRRAHCRIMDRSSLWSETVLLGDCSYLKSSESVRSVIRATILRAHSSCSPPSLGRARFWSISRSPAPASQ